MTTTRYDRMRAAAEMFDELIVDEVCNPPTLEHFARLRDSLRADAIELEAVERETREAGAVDAFTAQFIADRIRGNK